MLPPQTIANGIITLKYIRKYSNFRIGNTRSKVRHYCSYRFHQISLWCFPNIIEFCVSRFLSSFPYSFCIVVCLVKYALYFIIFLYVPFWILTFCSILPTLFFIGVSRLVLFKFFSLMSFIFIFSFFFLFCNVDF